MSCEKDDVKAKFWNKDWMIKNPITQNPWNLDDPIVQKKMSYLMFIHRPEVIVSEAVEKVS